MVNPPKHRGPYDLLVVVTLTGLMVVCITLIPSDTLRIVIAVPFIVFSPGYSLLAAMFPRRDTLSGVERFALSFVASMAAVTLIGLILNFLWRISLYPVVTSIAAFTAIMCAVAYYRRSQVAEPDRAGELVAPRIAKGRPFSTGDRILAAMLVVLAAGAVATFVYAATRPRSPERFTEFYLLGFEGTMQSYPGSVVLGTDAEVTVGVANHEGREMTYRVRVLLDNSELQAPDGVMLGDGETWEETVTLTPTVAGDNQQVEFLLYGADDSEPYRRLHLWIDVRDPTAPPSTP